MKSLLAFVLLTLLLTVSCSQNDEKETPSKSEEIISDSSREVESDYAQDLMGAYQLWRSMTPDEVTWDSVQNTLTYTVKQFDRTQDSTVIRKINEIVAIYEDVEYSEEPANNFVTFPFTNPNTTVQSFYIDTADIIKINDKMKGKEFSGYRAYLAMEPDAIAQRLGGMTHLYLGPATKSADSIYTDPTIRNNKDQPIFLDLILPCPNGCPEGISFGSNIINFHPNKYLDTTITDPK